MKVFEELTELYFFIYTKKKKAAQWPPFYLIPKNTYRMYDMLG